MENSHRRNSATLLRRALIGVAALALAWALAVAVIGGLNLSVGSLHISSRRPWPVFGGAAVCLLAAWALSARPLAGTPLRTDFHWWARRLGDVPAYVSLHPAILIAITFFVLHVQQWLVAPPLWLDEEMIALNVRDRSLTGLGGTLWLGQSAPLGWLAIQRAVFLSFGTGELMGRLVPLLFGVATVATALWIGTRWMGRVGAVLLVLLCSIGALVVHYFFEIKHYSADTFFGLLLPALVVWALEGASPQDRRRRTVVWWIVAAAGQWVANGALFVAPACALLLCAGLWRRDGRAGAAWVMLTGLIWLSCFALHYAWAITYTHNNSFLRNYWASELPPASSGAVERVVWAWNRLAELAATPAGTKRWVLFWLCAIVGLAAARHRLLGIAMVTTPISAFVFGAAGVVPLYERFVIWMVPALYAGIALAADRTVTVAVAGGRQRQSLRLVLALAAAVPVAIVSADVYANGRRDLATASPADSKHLLDDRAAVRWLLGHRRPGEPIVTSRLGWPAVWWYANIPIDDRRGAGARHPDGAMLYEVVHRGRAEECEGRTPLDLLRGQQRVLIYLGFHDVPQGFIDLLLHQFDRLGAIVALETFSARGTAAVVDLQESPAREATSLLLKRAGRLAATPLHGCVAMRPMRRW